MRSMASCLRSLWVVGGGDGLSDSSYVYPSRSSEMMSCRVEGADGTRPCGDMTLAIAV